MERTVFEGVKAPVDDEGFVQAFASEDAEGQRAFFETYGFVVVRDVLDSTEVEIEDNNFFSNTCQATVDELWRDLQQLASSIHYDDVPVISRNDPNTWGAWPKLVGGILGNEIAAGPQAWSNRQHPRVHQVFAHLLATEKLIAGIDRYGIMRPTKQIKFTRKTTKQAEGEAEEEGGGEEVEEEVVEDRPEWQTKESWFHWDLAVWAWFGLAPGPKEEDVISGWTVSGSKKFMTETNAVSEFKGFEKLQGLVALSDSTETDGGFEAIPGFHNFLETWAKETPLYNPTTFVSVPKEDPMLQHGQKITARKGSLVVWSSRLPHCNYPNTGSNFRFVQYIRMGKILKDKLPKDFAPSELGRLVFGLAPWEGLEAEAKDGDKKKCLLM